MADNIREDRNKTGKNYTDPTENTYEAFLQRFAEEYSYCVYILTSPEDKVYIGYCKGNPIRRWQNGKGYRKNKDLTAAINHFGWDRFQKKIFFSIFFSNLS